VSDSEFTREKPNEQTYLSTLVKYLEFKGERFLASLLRDAKCTIQESSTFSKKRWNGLSTTIYFRIPVEKLAVINDAVKRKLIDFCDEVMPKEIGFDVVAVEFSPLLVAAKKLDKPDTNIVSENVVVNGQKEEAMWDVFICHASEDKNEIARPLAEALGKRGLKVWYDEFTLTLGDSLSRKIDEGLANSRFGAVILSPSFFKKQWPQNELDGLRAKELSYGKTILPIWHVVDRDYVLRYSPMLADKLAVSTSEGLKKVVEEIVKAVSKEKPLKGGVTEDRKGGKPKLVVGVPAQLPYEKIMEVHVNVGDSLIKEQVRFHFVAVKNLGEKTAEDVVPYVRVHRRWLYGQWAPGATGLSRLAIIAPTGKSWIPVKWSGKQLTPNEFNLNRDNFATAIVCDRLMSTLEPVSLYSQGVSLAFALFFTVKGGGLYLPTATFEAFPLPCKFQIVLYFQPKDLPEVRAALYEVNAASWDSFRVARIELPEDSEDRP
jgi:hypothetical protein